MVAFFLSLNVSSSYNGTNILNLDSDHYKCNSRTLNNVPFLWTPVSKSSNYVTSRCR